MEKLDFVAYGICLIVMIGVAMQRAPAQPETGRVVIDRCFDEPSAPVPKCCFCGELMDCPKCGAANFAPRLDGETHE